MRMGFLRAQMHRALNLQFKQPIRNPCAQSRILDRVRCVCAGAGAGALQLLQLPMMVMLRSAMLTRKSVL